MQPVWGELQTVLLLWLHLTVVSTVRRIKILTATAALASLALTLIEIFTSQICWQLPLERGRAVVTLATEPSMPLAVVSQNPAGNFTEKAALRVAARTSCTQMYSDGIGEFCLCLILMQTVWTIVLYIVIIRHIYSAYAYIYKYYIYGYTPTWNFRMILTWDRRAITPSTSHFRQLLTRNRTPSSEILNWKNVIRGKGATHTEKSATSFFAVVSFYGFSKTHAYVSSSTVAAHTYQSLYSLTIWFSPGGRKLKLWEPSYARKSAVRGKWFDMGPSWLCDPTWCSVTSF